MESKALKATYALLRVSKGAPISVAKKLFDQLITPVHTYGAELWLPYVCPRAITKYGIIDTFNNHQNTLQCDKNKLMYLKYSLGMHRTASNFAIIGETATHPLYIKAITAAIKYYKRLIHPEAPTLMKHVCRNNRLYWRRVILVGYPLISSEPSILILILVRGLLSPLPLKNLIQNGGSHRSLFFRVRGTNFGHMSNLKKNFNLKLP